MDICTHVIEQKDLEMAAEIVEFLRRRVNPTNHFDHPPTDSQKNRRHCRLSEEPLRGDRHNTLEFLMNE